MIGTDVTAPCGFCPFVGGVGNNWPPAWMELLHPSCWGSGLVKLGGPLKSPHCLLSWAVPQLSVPP